MRKKEVGGDEEVVWCEEVGANGGQGAWGVFLLALSVVERMVWMQEAEERENMNFFVCVVE